MGGSYIYLGLEFSFGVELKPDDLRCVRKIIFFFLKDFCSNDDLFLLSTISEEATVDLIWVNFVKLMCNVYG